MSKESDDEKKIHGMAADLRIIAADISNAAKRYEEKISRLQDEHNRELATALEDVRKQLPDGMKHCTIVFRKCPVGHGRLVGENWGDVGCPWCAVEKHLKRVYELEAELANKDAVIRQAAAAPDYVTRKELVDALEAVPCDGPTLHALAAVIGRLRK